MVDMLLLYLLLLMVPEQVRDCHFCSYCYFYYFIVFCSSSSFCCFSSSRFLSSYLKFFLWPEEKVMNLVLTFPICEYGDFPICMRVKISFPSSLACSVDWFTDMTRKFVSILDYFLHMAYPVDVNWPSFTGQTVEIVHPFLQIKIPYFLAK
jgi:hypothetical protein